MIMVLYYCPFAGFYEEYRYTKYKGSNLMDNENRIETLVHVAKLYYEQNYSQDMIAKDTGLSRSYISKLLTEAKQRGIVKIEVIVPTHTETPMEKRIREMFNLKKVIIAPKVPKINPLEQVAKEAAKYIADIITDGSTIGLCWGETLYECSKALIDMPDLENVVTVQLCGGISNVRKNVYVSEISANFSKAFNGTPYIFPMPAIVNNPYVRKIIFEESSIKEVIEHAKKSNIAVITTGRFDIHSPLARAGYLSEKDIKELAAKGAVGDICTHIINEQGQICDKELDDRTLSIPLEEIKAIDTRICVAIGQDKVKSIAGALRGNIINVFITNEDTVELLLEYLQ